jgi:hypothetical protein
VRRLCLLILTCSLASCLRITDSCFMYLSQYERRSSEENSSRASLHFPPLFFVCASRLWTLFFSSPSLSCVTSVHLRSHADASYRAAVCISSDVLLLTALLTSCPSFLCPPQTHPSAPSRATLHFKRDRAGRTLMSVRRFFMDDSSDNEQPISTLDSTFSESFSDIL